MRKGGGVIHIPFGTYMVASVHLYDNIHFVLEPGAKLLGHIFIILSNRGRGPEGTEMGSVKNITISNLTATGPYIPWEAPQLTTLFESEKECMSEIMPSTITGQSDKKVENITLTNISVTVPGGGTQEDRKIVLPEVTKLYPENSNFGKVFPTYGLFIRHAQNITLSNVHIETIQQDKREMLIFEDVENLKIIDQKEIVS